MRVYFYLSTALLLYPLFLGQLLAATRCESVRIGSPDTYCSPLLLSFSHVLNASWPHRHNHGMHALHSDLHYLHTSSGNPTTAPAGSFVVWGGTDINAVWNDVWVSSDLHTWDLVAGRSSSTGSAYPPYDNTSYPWRQGGVTCADKMDSLYVMGGSDSRYEWNIQGFGSSDVLNWQRRNNQNQSFYAWQWAACWINYEREVFLLEQGGYVGGKWHNDLWKSDDFGVTWIVLPPPPMSAGYIHAPAAVDDWGIPRVELLYVIGGGRSIGPSNQVWYSSNNAMN